MQRVINRSKLQDFSFWQRLVTNIVLTFCCCCSDKDCYKRRKKRNEAHTQMLERLSSEVDILNFIQTSRTLRLMTSIMLRPNQRQLVPYFRSYQIDKNNPKIKKTRDIPVKKLLDKFDPVNDSIDRRIYYGITNKKIDPSDKFSDESDDNEYIIQTISEVEKSPSQLVRNTFDPGRLLRKIKVRQEVSSFDDAPSSSSSPEFSASLLRPNKEDAVRKSLND